MTLAGTPATVTPAGTEWRTTAPAPTTAPSPISVPGRAIAPIPTWANGGQQGGVAILRVAAGMLRAGLSVPESARHGGVLRHAGRRGRHLRHGLVYRCFLALEIGRAHV